jgi:hypothetical protein
MLCQNIALFAISKIRSPGAHLPMAGITADPICPAFHNTKPPTEETRACR